MPEEEAAHQGYQARWDEEDQREHEWIEKIARDNEVHNKHLEVKREVEKKKKQAKQEQLERTLKTQRDELLAQKLAQEMTSQVDSEHQVAQMEAKERWAAEMRE